MTRREFSKQTRLDASERCRNADGIFACEDCTAELTDGNMHFDHVNPDALGGLNDLANCQVLCRTCHGLKTFERDIPAIAKSNRVRNRARGIRKPSTFQGWRTFAGEPVRNPKLRRRP
jgi:5-methylcytosine-specific restriction enzyme A